MINTKQCEMCKYKGYINGFIMCDYILIELKRRGCYKGRCTKFEKGKKEKKFNY